MPFPLAQYLHFMQVQTIQKSKGEHMTTLKFIQALGAALLLASLSVVGFAQRNDRWEYLGQATVNGLVDHDRITVGRQDGRFRRIQLRVEGGPIAFQRVMVHYSNGATEEVNLRDRIPAGGQTRAIDLRGGDRAISYVDFWYGRANWLSGAQPRVQLYAVDVEQRNDHPDNSWSYLGQANVDGRIDHDRIMVGRNDGRFRSIQIRVEGAPIEFERVTVHYANGASENVTMRDRIPAGGQTRAIDLRGNNRAIQSVEFWYSRANWRTGYQPRVQLYGR